MNQPLDHPRAFRHTEQREPPLTLKQILVGIVGAIGAWIAVELWMLL